MNSLCIFTRATVANASRLLQTPTVRNFRVSASYKNDNDEDANDAFSSLLTAYAALPSGIYGCSPTVYDTRKFSHFLPDCNPCRVCFETPILMPCGIFRFTGGEVLGPRAGKCNCYKNPEYYAYHNMSYYDIHLYLSCQRAPVPDSKRKH